MRLCSALDQTDQTRHLLAEFVRTGSKEEAVMATRALCGHCLVRADTWPTAEHRRLVRQRFDPAPDNQFWVPLDELRVLLDEAFGAPKPLPPNGHLPRRKASDGRHNDGAGG